MDRPSHWIFGALVTGITLVFVLSPLTTHAYSTGSGPAMPAAPDLTSGNGSSLDNLLSPFSNFVNSMRSNNNVSIPLRSIPTVATNPQSVFQSIDDWFMRTIGVSLSTLLHDILTILAWILNFAKRVVDWLLSLFH